MLGGRISSVDVKIKATLVQDLIGVSVKGLKRGSRQKT